MTDVVLTSLLTSEPDPQRGVHLDSDVELLQELRDSVHRCGRYLVVLNDCLDVDDEVDELVKVTPGGNPYFARWRHVADWLGANRDVARVWCVDGTDVEMLRDPFPHMRSGVVYTGSEPYQLGGDTPFHRWLHSSCPSRSGWYLANPHRPFLNMGVLGGSRFDVLMAAQALAAAEADGDRWEIGAWQQIAADLFDGRLVTGEPIHTRFRANEYGHPTAWFRHK